MTLNLDLDTDPDQTFFSDTHPDPTKTPGSVWTRICNPGWQGYIRQKECNITFKDEVRGVSKSDAYSGVGEGVNMVH